MDKSGEQNGLPLAPLSRRRYADASRGEGDRPRKPKSTIKPLRPGDVWHPHIGAPRGNRNAAKPSVQLQKRIRDLKRRIRAAIRSVDDRQAGNSQA